MTGIVVFTDLDGTLLDHSTYRYDAARPALDRLRRAGVPLVLASSKTAAEMAPLRAELGFAHCPALVENGAGVLEPFAARADASRTHDRLLAGLSTLPEELRARFRGFSDMDIAELIGHTGLSETAAQNAARRDFSEPGLWTGDEAVRQDFLAALAGQGITAHQGGRFMTLSLGGDKASGLRRIASRYGDGCRTIALGDAPNDAGMLAAADYSVVVRNPAHDGPGQIGGEAEGRTIRTELSGPAGWNQAVNMLLDRLTAKGED